MVRDELGRRRLMQWDINQRLIVDVPAGTQIHYASEAIGDKALVTTAYEENGLIYSNIPNILLQSPGTITVYVYPIKGEEAHTKSCATLVVLPRAKPEDYVYTETEVLSYRKLADEIGDLAKLTTTARENLVAAINEAATKQPDWNQNDETAKDYVKNRPFYTGDPVETVIVEESTVTFEDAGGKYMASFQNTFEVTEDMVGETWKISWDGTVYECPCVDAGGLLAVGNLSIVGEGSDTGEPFVMGIMNVEKSRIFTADTSASHTFSISRTVVPVVKIDKKYLPDEIVTDVESIVVSHNTSTDAHSDIRLLISGLTDRLNALADSDDTTLDQLSEVVAYIKSNRNMISSITTSKVNVSDIINNLTTNVSNKPLSAAQGVALKALIDKLKALVDEMNVPASTAADNGKVLSVVDGAPSWTITSSEQAAISAANAEQSATIAQECAQAMAGTFDFTGYLRYKVVDAAPVTYEEGVLYLVTTS